MAEKSIYQVNQAEKMSAREIDHGPEVIPDQYYHPKTPISPTYNVDENKHYPQQPQQPVNTERRICGLRRTSFFLFVVLAAVVIAASVGGGVGGSLAVLRMKEQTQAEVQASAAAKATATDSPVASSTVTSVPATVTNTPTTGSTQTTANAASISIPTTGLVTTGDLQINCPNLTGRTMSVTVGGVKSNYDTECNVDYTGDDVDVMALVSYTLDTCIMACSSYNKNINGTSERCIGVQFNGVIDIMTKNYGGNCFLKKNTGTKETTTETSTSIIKKYNMHLAAMLS
ncbi:hypothetical protein COL26b_006565 [Colletotrichum chrysophilum]|uniref:uncharacterized protein n=1 Tax=Colletotrichum chrysophilum TaxID=1836956 RepID=UPI0022FFEC90|nr:uncharacterized protein COL26b_006565 [Colletotrichum chrysophilum]KAJ0375193.1 hypothetical protein COL26b_006565 [Colletotrichum chrysophilum]